jgi:hypothetical protein
VLLFKIDTILIFYIFQEGFAENIGYLSKVKLDGKQNGFQMDRYSDYQPYYAYLRSVNNILNKSHSFIFSEFCFFSLEPFLCVSISQEVNTIFVLFGNVSFRAMKKL